MLCKPLFFFFLGPREAPAVHGAPLREPSRTFRTHFYSYFYFYFYFISLVWTERKSTRNREAKTPVFWAAKTKTNAPSHVRSDVRRARTSVEKCGVFFFKKKPRAQKKKLAVGAVARPSIDGMSTLLQKKIKKIKSRAAATFRARPRNARAALWPKKIRKCEFARARGREYRRRRAGAARARGGARTSARRKLRGRRGFREGFRGVLAGPRRRRGRIGLRASARARREATRPWVIVMRTIITKWSFLFRMRFDVWVRCRFRRRLLCARPRARGRARARARPRVSR